MMSSTTRSGALRSRQAAQRRGALGGADAVAVLREIAADEVADVAVVVDDEDVRRASIACLRIREYKPSRPLPLFKVIRLRRVAAARTASDAAAGARFPRNGRAYRGVACRPAAHDLQNRASFWRSCATGRPSVLAPNRRDDDDACHRPRPRRCSAADLPFAGDRLPTFEVPAALAYRRAGSTLLDVLVVFSIPVARS